MNTQIKNTNLQKANTTQYVQHSHFSKTKKDKDTDALQWTANAGCIISQVKKGKYALTCKKQISTSRCHIPNAQIKRTLGRLMHWHGLLLLL